MIAFLFTAWLGVAALLGFALAVTIVLLAVMDSDRIGASEWVAIGLSFAAALLWPVILLYAIYEGLRK